MICPQCGYLADDKAEVCLGCGINLRKVQAREEKRVSVGWWWLGFFVPFAGILIWAFCHCDEPRKAKRAGIGALCGIMVIVLLYLLVMLLPIFLLFSQVPSYNI